MQLNYMYVVVRTDLEKSSSAVQAGHALAQYCIDYPEHQTEWNNNYLIYLVAENEQQLEELLYKLSLKDLEVSIFREPDLDNQITAICCLTKKNSSIFKNYPLL